MAEYDIIVCQAYKLSQIWSHILQNDPIKIKTNNYKTYDRLPNKVVYHLMVPGKNKIVPGNNEMAEMK